MNDDSISRKETVRFIREKIRLSTFMQRSVDKADKACEELCERIEKEVPTIEPERQQGEWVPCSERLPEEGRYLVDVSLSVFSPQVLNYRNGEWFYDGCKSMGLEMPTVLAWMPLPEPYRSDNNE